MNNKIVLAAGGISAVAALVLLLSSGDSVDRSQLDAAQLDSSQDVKAKPAMFKQTHIDYAVSKKRPKANKIPKQAYRKPEAVVNEKPLPLGMKTVDATRTYTISLYDPAREYKPSEAPRAKSFTYLEGTIDGRKFTMKVPDYFLNEPDNVKLSIRNRRTNTTQTIAASSLLDELRESPSEHAHKEVHLDSGSLDNYRYDEKPLVSPPSPY